MKKALPEAKRIFRRIIVIFLLAIILPSAVLGYFGIYAIESESEVLKGGVKDNNFAVAKFVYAQLRDEILEREGKVRRDVNLFLPKEYDMEKVFELMDRLQLVHSIVEESFLITENGTILYPLRLAPEESSVTSSSRIPTTIPRSEFQKHIELEQIYNEGRKLEFSSNSYPLAIEQYEKVAHNKINEQLAAEAGFAIARCYSKAGDHKNAIGSLEKLLYSNPNIRLVGGLPVSIEARLAVSQEYSAVGDDSIAVEIMLDTYEKLLDYEYNVSRDEFEDIACKIRKNIDTIVPAGNLPSWRKDRYDNLRKLEIRRISQDNYARMISTVFMSRLLEAYDTPAQVPQTGRHLNADVGDKKMTAMFFFPLKIGSVENRPVRLLYGCILNTEYIREMANELVAGGRFEEGLVVAVADADNLMAVSPGAPEDFYDSTDSFKPFLSVEYQFPEILPHWSIDVYYLNMSKLDSWISRRLLTHVAMVILLIVVILAGVFLSLRGISRELELAKIKSDFVSNVSHELKTPLTSIRMFAEMLKSGRVKTEQKRQEYYDIMTAESERLSRLIGNVLDFARVQEGRKQYDFQHVDANKLVREVEQIALPYMAQQNFNLSVNTSRTEMPVEVDRDSIGQVLLNILNNAVKYSEEKREISISTRIEGNFAVIDVRDHGIGIPEEEIKKIFNKFYRIDSRPGYQSAGTGIGLTLAKQIIEAHDGKIEVKSKVGEGSTFSVLLPLSKETNTERSPSS